MVNVAYAPDVLFTEDFLKADAVAGFSTGGAGTAAALLSAGISQADLVTGATDNRASIIYLPNLAMTPAKSPLLVARIKPSTLAAIKVELGFSDSAHADVLGASGTGLVNSLAATPTLNSSGGSDVAVAIFDTDSALANNTNWRLVTAKAGTTSLVTPSDTLPAAAKEASTSWMWVELRIDPATTTTATVRLFINSILVASKTDAITVSATLNPYIMVQARAAASKTLSVDYVSCSFKRDVTTIL